MSLAPLASLRWDDSSNNIVQEKKLHMHDLWLLSTNKTSQNLSSSVLSIHKRPTSTSSNFTFPVKGWRGMLDWVRTSEEKISVSRDALSIEQPGM